MHQRQRALTLILWTALVVAMVAVAVSQFLLPRRAPAQAGTAGHIVFAESPQHDELKELFAAADFNLIDQDGRALATSELRGNPWIADFIFTSCAGSCPLMSHKMAELQKELPSQVKLVSFTVDPDRDTPAVLKQYANALKADGSRWHFLTGTKEQIFAAAAGMKISARPAGQNDGILHSNRFVLVDSAGKIVGYYDSSNGGEMKRLVRDARELARF